MNCSFADIATAIAAADRILVTSHMRPDGDALGSVIAFALPLLARGKNVKLWNEDGAVEKFHYLPHHELVVQPPATPEDFDLVISLDSSGLKRLGTVTDALGKVGQWINIDHHVSNEVFGDLNYIDPTSPATGQIVFEYFQACGEPITTEMAENLFAAISTDTGSFQYAGTNARTFHAASELVKAGVRVEEISRRMYESMPRRRLELMRHALNSARFLCDDRLATFSLSLETIHTLGLLPEDNEGIIDHLRSIEGVVAAVFFEELPEGKVRVSARSKDPRVNVCDICAAFGGGGHPLASGARVKGSLEEVEKKFCEAVCHEIRNRN